MVQSVSLEQLRKDAVDIFHNGFACSESVIYSIRKNFELDMSDDAFAMSTGFPWGLGGAGCLCGAVAGGTMCIGYVFGRRKPGEPAGECHKLIAPYGDRNSPERKSFCTELVEFAVTEAAKIIAREKGIKAE